MSATLVLAAVAAANVSAYLFHVAMTRLLSPAAYGGLGALLAVVVVLAVPTAAAQAVTARRSALLSSDPAGLRALIGRAVGIACWIAGLVAGLVVATSPLLGRFLNLDSVVPVVLISPVIVAAVVGAVARGALQGTQQFGRLGATLVVPAVLKLAVGTLLVGVGGGLTAAIASVAVAEMSGAALALAWAPHGRRSPNRPLTRSLVDEARSATAVLGAFWLLVTVDLPLVRHYLPPEASGRYAAAALIGRAVLFLPAGVAMVVYPKFSAGAARPQARRLLIASLAATGALGLLATTIVASVPGLTATLFGSAYHGLDGVGALLTLAMMFFGLVNVLIFHRLAATKPPVKTLWIAAAAEVAAIVAFHQSGVTVALIVMAVAASLAVVLGAHALRRLPGRAEGELWRQTPTGVELSVVSPVFNGAEHIARSVAALDRELRSSGLVYELILVSDGSVDGTQDAALAAEASGLTVIHYDKNRGKGFALRTGLARARGDYVAFIDSDGDLDAGQIAAYVDLMRRDRADLVIGSKRHPASEVSYPPLRRLMSWIYHRLIRALFGLSVTDVQTGIKLVRREVLANVLPRLVEKRYAFDLELLVAARRLGYRHIVEAPVRLDYQFTSTISPMSVAGILRDTAAVWYRRYVLGHYDLDGSAGLQATAPPASWPASARAGT